MLVFLVIGSGSCSRPDQPSPKSTEHTPNSRETIVPTASPSPPGVKEVDVVENILPWQTVEAPRFRVNANPLYDGNVASWTSYTDQQRSIQIVKIDSQETVLHEAPEHWQIAYAELQGQYLALLENERTENDYHLWVYDLQDRAETLVEAWPGKPKKHLLPQPKLDANRLVWNTTLEDGRTCVRLLDLSTEQQSDLFCSTGQNEWFSLPYLSWPFVTYTTVQDNLSGCRTVFSNNMITGATASYDTSPCLGYQGASNQVIRVWLEISLGKDDYWGAKVYGKEANGSIAALGTAGIRSPVICQERAYWLWNQPGQTSSTEIRSWAPGHLVETIYRSPDLDQDHRFSTYGLGCHGDLVSFARTSRQEGNPQEILFAQWPSP